MSHSAGKTPAADPYSWKSQLRSGGQRSDIPAEYQKELPPGAPRITGKTDPQWLAKQERKANEPLSERYARQTRNAAVIIAVIMCVYVLAGFIVCIALLVHQNACHSAGTC